MGSAIEVAVERAIAQVDDPCSIAANAPLNVFELGLVREWSVDADGDVFVQVSPTSPSCVLIGSITQGIEARVAEVRGVRSVKVEIDAATFWTPEMMTDAGRGKLQVRRSGSMQRVPVRPRQWEAGAASAHS